MTAPILAVERLSKHFPMGRGQKVHAVNDVGFTIRPDQPDRLAGACLLYTSPSPRDRQKSRMPSSA